MNAQQIEILVNEKYPLREDMNGSAKGDWMALRFEYRHFLLDANREAEQYRTRSTDELIRDMQAESFAGWRKSWNKAKRSEAVAA